MRLLKTSFFIAVVIFIINFIVSNFNSEEGLLSSVKDNFYKYKISAELKSTKLTEQLSKLLTESDKIDSDALRIKTKVSILNKSIKLQTNNGKESGDGKIDKQDALPQEQKKAKGNDESPPKQDVELRNFQENIKKNIENDLQKSLSSSSAAQKDKLVRAIYNELEKNDILNIFEKDSTQESQSELDELLQLNKILEMIKNNKINEAKLLATKVKNKEILGALSLLAKDTLTNQRPWMLQVKQKIDEIENLLSEAKFLEAHQKIEELKQIVRKL